jgi:hypothetical protein
MEYPRARLYQPRIQQYLERVAGRSDDYVPTLSSQPGVAGRGDRAREQHARLATYRHFVAGAGTTRRKAISVETWAAQKPIDVDAEDEIEGECC